MINISILFLLLFLAPCNGPLGMENGDIANSQLSSQGIAAQGAGAIYARLNGPSAWCLMSNSMNPGIDYLQIDLLKPTRITAITTQGQSNSYVREYALQYCATSDMNSCALYLDGQSQVHKININILNSLLK